MIVFQPGSPYLEEVNYWLLLLLQMGFHENWISRLMPNATNCKGLDAIISSHGRKDLSLTFFNVSGLFSFLLLGLLAAILGFGVETCARVCCPGKKINFGSGKNANKRRDVVPSRGRNHW